MRYMELTKTLVSALDYSNRFNSVKKGSHVRAFFMSIVYAIFLDI